MFDWKNETESEPRYIEQIDHKKCTEKMLFNKMKREKIYKTKILSLSFSVAFFVLLPFAYFLPFTTTCKLIFYTLTFLQRSLVAREFLYFAVLLVFQLLGGKFLISTFTIYGSLLILLI